jgi:hypothetical protein
LNELSDDWICLEVRSERSPTSPDARELTIYYAEGKKRVIVTITTEWTISVQITRPDLVEWNDWTHEVKVN